MPIFVPSYFILILEISPCFLMAQVNRATRWYIHNEYIHRPMLPHYYLKTIGRARVSRVSRVILRCTSPQLHMHRWPMSVAHALTYIPLKTANRAFMVARTIEPLCVQDTRRSVLKGSPPTPLRKQTKKQLPPPSSVSKFLLPVQGKSRQKQRHGQKFL